MDLLAGSRGRLRSLVAGLCLLTGGLCRSARAEEPRVIVGERSVAVAYVLGLGFTLAPMYGTMAMAEYRPGSEYGTGGRALMLSGLCLGPSVGYGYARSWGYAAVSGAIKGGLLAAALYADGRNTSPIDGRGPEYGLTLLVGMGVGLWDVADLLSLRRTVVRNNERDRQGESMAVTPFFSGNAGTIKGGGLMLASRF